MNKRCRFNPPNDGLLVIWEITHRCNLKCLHCCTDSGKQNNDYDELIREEIENFLSIIDQIANEIYVTGGEPLYSRAFLDSIATFGNIETPHYLATNGYYLTRDIAEKLKEARFGPTTISVDGGIEKTHNNVRGDGQAWKLAFRAIRNLKDIDMGVRVSHVLTPESISEIGVLLQTLEDEGVDEFVVNTMVPTGRGARHRELYLSPDAIDFVHQELKSFQGRLKIDANINSVDNDERRPDTCPAGKGVIYIAPNGDVSGCSWLYKLNRERYCAGNLRVNDIDSIIDIASNKLNRGDCLIP